MFIRTIGRYGVAVVAAAGLALTATACNTDTTSSDKPTAAATASGGTKPSRHAPSTPPSAKPLIDQFKAYVLENGQPNNKTAVKHVTELVGGDKKNDIMDTAEIHTDYSGDIMSDDAASAKLLAASFAAFQQSRGMQSKNGVVTVYNAKGSLLSSGPF